MHINLAPPLQKFIDEHPKSKELMVLLEEAHQLANKFPLDASEIPEQELKETFAKLVQDIMAMDVEIRDAQTLAVRFFKKPIMKRLELL